ncbi:MAG: divergent PAP2 family protein [Eubacteriales bacterium]|nr:divergent PAP2 family protein [Eubacteriales bacterium]
MNIFLTELLSNRVLICGISGWALAQVLKTLIYALIHHEFRVERMVGDGGMPSAHSATVSSMATASGLIYGFGTFEFAIACMMAIIVMHDAMGVRMETGKQGKVLNEMIEFFRTEGFVEAFKKNNKMYEFWEASLKEFVGHTPLQVAAGCLLGIGIACAMLL